jgi:hypothetical protein
MCSDTEDASLRQAHVGKKGNIEIQIGRLQNFDRISDVKE